MYVCMVACKRAWVRACSGDAAGMLKHRSTHAPKTPNKKASEIRRATSSSCFFMHSSRSCLPMPILLHLHISPMTVLPQCY